MNSPSIKQLIPLDCCNIHYLHPSKFKVWSKWKKGWLTQVRRSHGPNSNYYNLHTGSEKNYQLTQNKVRELQRNARLPLIKRPEIRSVSMTLQIAGDKRKDHEDHHQTLLSLEDYDKVAGDRSVEEVCNICTPNSEAKAQ